MLDKQEIRQIVNILVKKLEKRCKEQLDIELVVRSSVKDYLAENGFDSKYGARPLKRAIQNKLEDRMAEEILDGKIHRGDRVIVSVSKKVIKFSVNDLDVFLNLLYNIYKTKAASEMAERTEEN